MQPFLMVLIIACHFFSLTKAILIFSGLDALHQHFLVLKVPKQSLFCVAQCCFSTFCLFSHKNSAGMDMAGAASVLLQILNNSCERENIQA